MFEGVFLTALGHQWFIYFISVLLGVLVAIFALVRRKTEQFWKLVDLTWISVGTIATVAAVTTTLYISEISDAQRRIDRLRATIADLNTDAEMFVAIHCSERTLSSIIQVTSLAMREACQDAIVVASETQSTSDLISFTELLAPSIAINGEESRQRQIHAAFDLTANTYTNENGTELTMASLIQAKWLSRAKLNDAEFEGLGNTILFTGFYDKFFFELSAIRSRSASIAMEVESLRSSWQLILGKRSLLALRVIALTLISFVAPLRIGKSIFDIQNSKQS